MKTLIKELRAQFSIKEWIDAIKQAVKELFMQWSVKEWVHAFFVYVPTANAKSIKSGYKTIPGGSSDEIFKALTKFQKEVSSGIN